MMDEQEVKGGACSYRFILIVRERATADSYMHGSHDDVTVTYCMVDAVNDVIYCMALDGRRYNE